MDVLANDTDGDDVLTLISTTQGAHGLVKIVGNKIQFVPDPSYDGNDFFSYQVSDGRGGLSTGYVSLDNQMIDAVNDVVTRGSSGGNVAILPLANDTDEDGDSLTIVDVSQPAHGSVSSGVSSSLTYQPDAGFTGTDRFTYTVTDNRGMTATATIEVRPLESQSRKLLSVGDVVTSPKGDLTVLKLGAAGSTGNGILRISTEMEGRKVFALVNTVDQSFLLGPGDPVPDISGAVIKAVEEPAGRAVLVTYKVNGNPAIRRALLFLSSAGAPQLVAHEGQVLPDTTAVASIDRFSEVNGRVVLLGKVKLATGKSVQSLRVWENGQATELVRAGATEIEEHRVKSIMCLVPAVGSPADNRWIDESGQVVAGLTFQDGTRGQCLLKAGTEPDLQGITRDSSPFGLEFRQFGLPTVCPNGMAYRAFEVSAFPPAERRWTIYKYESDDVDSTGSVVTDEPLAFIKQLGDPVAGDVGSFAYLAQVGNKGPTSQALIWRVGFDRLGIVRQGSLLPGSQTERFGKIKSVVVPRGINRGPVFTAMTSRGLSLWMLRDTGEPELVVGPGMPLNIDGTERTVSSIRALEGAKGAGIAARGYDNFGRVDALIKFTDGTESLVQFSLR